MPIPHSSPRRLSVLRSAQPRDALAALAALGVIALLGVGSAHTALGREAPYRIAAQPGWVENAPIPELPEAVRESQTRQAGALADGILDLLFERQIDLRRDGDPERYTRVVQWLSNEVAVEQASQVQVAFDPHYQTVELHRLQVRRGAERIDKLRSARIELVQRQADLESRVFDGVHTLVLFIEDVRPGDVLEHAVTVRGQNPVFGTHRLASFRTGFSVPVERVVNRLLWPGRSEPVVQYHGSPLEPEVRSHSSHRELTWRADRVAAVSPDDARPGWHNAYGWIQITDFQSWGEVAQWALPLYSTQRELPDNVREVVAEIAAEYSGFEARAGAALRFVQDHVRYLGMELGEHSHRPTAPQVVLQRRFGDCKDKSLLLLQMLRALGAEAFPVLVNTRLGRGVRDFAPTPHAFNHVIVQLWLGENAHWLDPTALYQRGPLRRHRHADFGAGLVIAPRVRGLAQIEGREAGDPLIDVSVRFALGDGSEPVEMTVETVYRGERADGQRYKFRSETFDSVGEDYLQFYAALYPNIEALEAPSYEDDEARNLVTVRERYRIPDLWSTADAQATPSLDTELYPLELESMLRVPERVERRSPVALPHPQYMRYRIEAELAAGWSIQPARDRIESPGALLSRNTAVNDRTLELTWEYRTLRDHLNAAEVPEHAARVGAMRELLSFPITYSALAPGGPGKPGDVHWLIALLGAAVALLTAWAGRHIYAWSPEPRTLDAAGAARAERLEPGLRGWLVVLGLVLLLNTVRVHSEWFGTLPVYSSPNWAQVTNPGAASYNPALGPVLIAELVLNIALCGAWLLATLLYVRKKRAFPSFGAILFVATWLAGFLDAVIAGGLIGQPLTSEEISRMGGGIFGVVIWLRYLSCSARVQKTFVN